MEQRLQEYGEMEERLDGRLEGLQHEMQQSRPAVEAGACGEKTGEREGDAVVNGDMGILRS